jgi:hypothetical protein
LSVLGQAELPESDTLYLITDSGNLRLWRALIGTHDTCPVNGVPSATQPLGLTSILT